MRLDHIAYRVSDRHKTVEFFKESFGYRIPADLKDGFEIEFDDGSTAKCFALEPPEKPGKGNWSQPPWTTQMFVGLPPNDLKTGIEYHLAPEIFVSDGTPDSIVGKWVAERGDVGGIHHMAYQVKSVKKTMAEWKEKGYAEFTTDEPMKCPGLTQVFTLPSALTGVIYEFIEREAQGFCKDNVKELMTSTKDL